MAALKQVGVREFRDHATAYRSGSDPIAVTKHDRIIGVHVPMTRDEERIRQAFDALERTVNTILEETGLPEDDLAAMFDIRKPLERCLSSLMPASWQLNS